MQNFFVIQTAFIGDVVLATGILEKLHEYYPDACIDYMGAQGEMKDWLVVIHFYKCARFK